MLDKPSETRFFPDLKSSGFNVRWVPKAFPRLYSLSIGDAYQAWRRLLAIRTLFGDLEAIRGNSKIDWIRKEIQTRFVFSEERTVLSASDYEPAICIATTIVHSWLSSVRR